MASRRSPGSGTIETLPSGKARYKLPTADGRTLRSRALPSPAHAEMALDEMRARLCSGEVLDATTLGSWGWAWLDRRSTRNADTERGLWRHHVLGTPLAELPIEQVRPKALLGWAHGLRRHRKLIQTAEGRVPGDEPISVQTQRLCWALVARVLSAAVVEEIITHNPTKGLRPDWPDVSTEDDDWSFLLESEVVGLLSCEAIPLGARLHYQWAIASGARYHEQVAAFGALGIKAGKYGPICLTFTEADKVLRRLRKLARGQRSGDRG